MKLTLSQAKGAAGAALFGMFVSWPAVADMGPAVLVPAVGGVVWGLLLGIVVAIPRRLFGRRWLALAIYAASVVVAWTVNLQLPVDSLFDTMLVFVVPVLALIGLYICRRVADAVKSP
jgi:hypothetical protein